MSSGTVTFDYSASTFQKLTVAGALTIAVSNWPATGTYARIDLEIINGGNNVTWPASIVAGYRAVVLQTSGTDFIRLYTSDGGTTVYLTYLTPNQYASAMSLVGNQAQQTASLVGGVSPSGSTLAAGATNFMFIGFGCGCSAALTTEVQNQRVIRKAGTFKNLTLFVRANSLSGTCVVTFRKNTANGNQTWTILAGATGYFADLTNTDVVAPGDLIDLQAVTAAGTGTIELSFTMDFMVSGLMPTSLPGADTAGAGISNASLTRFLVLGGRVSANFTATESSTAIQADVPGKFRNMQMYVSANTRATPTVINFRKNGANGAQNFSIGAGATGFFEDTTNSDFVAPGDTFDVAVVNGTGAGTITVTYVCAEFDSFQAGKYQIFTSRSTAITTVARTLPLLGASVVTSGNIRHGVINRLTNLRANVAANTRDATETLSSQLIGQAVGNVGLSLAITAAGTGLFSDTTGYDLVYDSDLHALLASNSDSVGSYNFNFNQITVEHIRTFSDAMTRAGGDSAVTKQAMTYRVAAQFSQTSSVALANVPDLVTTVAAGATYEFEALLYTTSNSSGGVKAAIAGTATATSVVYEAVVLDVGAVKAQTRATTLATTVGGVTAVTAALIHIVGTIVVNASGTLSVQFAQNVSNGTASVVLVGSTLKIKEANL